MRIFAIIPAGGKGIRSGYSAPKQYLKFNGKELIAHTLEVFQKNTLVNEILIAAHPDYFSIIEKLKKKFNLNKISQIVKGGNERQDSVYNALASLEAKENDLIIVHDAARPLLSQKILTNAINLAKRKGNAVVCIKAKDTLIKGKDYVVSYINREDVYYVQTPQIFTYKDLMEAIETAYKKNFWGTDESMLVKRLGKEIFIAEGSPLNFKITTKEDIEMFKKLIR
jgi:2-C-methyl-D-erythritol 4-phosphate cytidylyltransferase